MIGKTSSDLLQPENYLAALRNVIVPERALPACLIGR